MQYTIEMEEGSTGSIIPEKLDYEFGQGRIKVVKDGETVLDKELISTPTKKYIFDIDDSVDVKPVEEFHVGNMLPQTPVTGVLTKESTEEENTENKNELTEEAAGSYIKTMIDSIGKAMKREWDKVPKNEKKLKELKTKLISFCNKNDVNVPNNGVFALVQASADDTVYGGMVCEATIGKNDFTYITDDSILTLEGVRDTIIDSNKSIELPQGLLNQIINISLIKTKLETAKNKKSEANSINKIKADLLNAVKRYENMTKNFDDTNKAKASKMLNICGSAVTEELKRRGINTEVADVMEESVNNPPKKTQEGLERQAKIDAKNNEIDKLKESFNKANPIERNKIKEKIKELNNEIYQLDKTSESDNAALQEYVDLEDAIEEQEVEEAVAEAVGMAFIAGCSLLIIAAITHSILTKLHLKALGKYFAETDKKFVLPKDMKKERYIAHFSDNAKGEWQANAGKKVGKMMYYLAGADNKITRYTYDGEIVFEYAIKSETHISPTLTFSSDGVNPGINIRTTRYIMFRIGPKYKKYEKYYRSWVLIKLGFDSHGFAADYVNDSFKKYCKGQKDEVPENAVKESYVDSSIASYLDLMSNFTEAANIDSDIKGILDIFNKKGYATKYSSAGHKKLRKKEDGEPDGVYYGKLYTDARLMFDGNFDFPPAPNYWHWRKVDGNDYLDVTPISYDKKDGSPDEAFAKWKKNYLESLRSYANSLPAKGEKSSSNTEEKEDKSEDEETKEYTLNIDNNFDMLFNELADILR